MDSRGPGTLLKLSPKSCMCVQMCIFLGRGSIDCPSFLQRSLIPKGSVPLLWPGATTRLSCRAPSPSLVSLDCWFLLLHGPSGQQPRHGGPR